jgi:hypothetical protein
MADSYKIEMRKWLKKVSNCAYYLPLVHPRCSGHSELLILALLACAEMFKLLGHCCRVVSPRDLCLKVDKDEVTPSSRKGELAWPYRVCREQTADFTESFLGRWSSGISHCHRQ